MLTQNRHAPLKRENLVTGVTGVSIFFHPKEASVGGNLAQVKVVKLPIFFMFPGQNYCLPSMLSFVWQEGGAVCQIHQGS